MPMTEDPAWTGIGSDHFIIDKLPGSEDRVVIATGFSGHGFKFASVIGDTCRSRYRWKH